MSRSRVFVVAVLVAAAWFGPGFVTADDESDSEPFGPIARFVETDEVDLDWQANPDVRDPFLPLVLPSAPASDVLNDTDQ